MASRLHKDDRVLRVFKRCRGRWKITLQKDPWILVRSGEALFRELSSGLSWCQAELLYRDWTTKGCNNLLPVLTEAKEMYKNGKGIRGAKQELIRLLNNLSVEGNDVIASTAKRKVSDSAQGRSNKVLRRKQLSIHHEQQLHTEAEDFPSESDDLDEAGEGPSEAYAHASPDVLVSLYLVA